MKLIIMTKRNFFVEEDKILSSLFDEGLECLHLYKPDSDPILSERLLTLLSDDCRRRVVVHDHFYLKDEYHLRGIHLNNADDEVPKSYGGYVSRTCHSVGELKAAKKGSSYVFLKTVFDSLSNPADKQTLSYDELLRASDQGLIDKKVMAMGGMKLDNLRMARDLGFGGVVVCGDLWNRFDIHSELDYKELIAHFVKLKKAVG